MKKSIERVRYLLKHFPETRDCDKKLWMQYMVKYHYIQNHTWSETLFEEMLKKSTPTFETLSRIRRKIQSCGEWIGNRREERFRLTNRYQEFNRGRHE